MIKIQTNELLIKYNIKPTITRIKIYEYILDNYNHPTCEIIYNNLVKELITLSRTTVYNTLKIFTEKNLIKKLDFGEGEQRYDFNTSTHIHFLCRKCNMIYDSKINWSIEEKSLLNDFLVEETQFTMRGICKKCLNKKNEEIN